MEFVVYERLSGAIPSPGAMAADRDLLERCGRAEQLGYDGVCLAGESAAAERALVFAAALAARTTRLPIRVILSGAPREGVGDGAMLDSLPGGRLVLAAPTDVASPYRRVLLAHSDAEARRLAGAAPGCAEVEDAFWADPDGPLVGSPETVVARLERLREQLGECELLLDFSFGELPPERVLGSLEQFSREIMPRFKPQPALPPTLA
jgi:alkanesulfonate monooxygenase SsuD/methylene tetrahydromethanopterin reductase-like flavin-dependent oxidoreductase (luciferase family)